MELSTADRLAIHELINLHGHLFDGGALHRLGELFTEDVVYDVSDLGGGSIVGIAAIREASLAVGDRNPLAHHVTNVIVSPGRTGDEARAQSKGLGVYADGTFGSVVYDDIVRRTPEGWRIERRTVIARRQPLTP